MEEEKQKRYEALKQIWDEVFALTTSPLYEYRTKNNYFPVMGEGSHFAPIIFVGEAPGRNEAIQGRPFVGAAGKILNELLEKAGIKREDVYITNIVKDRPPENRDPLPSEIAAYSGFLDRQIMILQPKVIVGLGRYSAKYVMEKLGLMDKVESISLMHGRVYEGEAGYGKVIVVPLYHPAVAVYDPRKKSELLKDFLVLKTLV
ncbi:MAG: uracil-DNA glycosylase [Candidatus Harrisonbacteria bacterium]|nr:uracil-DNA glycosylase [Candidatus Harrisonbacteria bacterium]